MWVKFWHTFVLHTVVDPTEPPPLTVLIIGTDTFPSVAFWFEIVACWVELLVKLTTTAVCNLKDPQFRSCLRSPLRYLTAWHCVLQWLVAVSTCWWMNLFEELVGMPDEANFAGWLSFIESRWLLGEGGCSRKGAQCQLFLSGAWLREIQSPCV